ncbi:hypothetical protein OAD06_05430 [Flavobacteriaceae bacterium]|nr:hypothetical protein [bacterium]MDB9913724.1 hypothetical protein [Flavobacteriaceae bacterium]
MEKINLTKKIIIQGDFQGRYHANEISTLSSFTDYDINIIDGKVSNARQTSYYEVISDESISFRVSKLEDVKITIEDSESNPEHIFIEDLEDVIIYDIKFNDVIKEGKSTLGIIKGKIYGSLVYNEEVELAKLAPKPPKKNLEIIKDTALKIKAKTERNFFPSLSIFFYGFLFVCLAFLLKEKLLIFLLFGVGIYILRSVATYLLKIIFRSASAVFILLILLGLWFVFSEGLETSRVENDEIVVEDPPEYNELISRPISWSDYDNRTYFGDFKFKYGDYIKSKENKEEIIPFSEKELYSSLNNFDSNKLDLIYSTLQKIKNDNNLNRNRFAEVVVSLIQSIPYSYNIDGNCNGDDLPSAYKNDIISGIPCISNVRHDILTPLEFLYFKKGDCDSRTVLIYTILKRFGYDVAILNSDLYSHSMIGINIPAYGKYKLINGKKYYFWETTHTGWSVGELPPKNWNISKWYLALK